MLYPLKFIPVYKGAKQGYIWGGRNFEKLGRTLPEEIVGESWEVSCHPDGPSIVSNGRFEGVSLPDLTRQFGRLLIGNALPEKDLIKFPLLVKLIDANMDLSVQVHPDDNYAQTHENGEYGKNEMWYIMAAEPGAKLVYDVTPGTTRESFEKAVKEDRIESCLKSIDIFPGDVVNIPAGLVHAIGKGILLAEIQQNSNTTYRVYDYKRVDKNGKSRPLHIEKALDVIDFNTGSRKEKTKGLKVNVTPSAIRTYLVANQYFSVEHCSQSGRLQEAADGSRFYIYVFLKGEGRIITERETTGIKAGESVLIPASIGVYTVEGELEYLKAYVPDLKANVVEPLLQAGYSMDEIYENVAGLK